MVRTLSEHASIQSGIWTGRDIVPPSPAFKRKIAGKFERKKERAPETPYGEILTFWKKDCRKFERKKERTPDTRYGDISARKLLEHTSICSSFEQTERETDIIQPDQDFEREREPDIG